MRSVLYFLAFVLLAPSAAAQRIAFEVARTKSDVVTRDGNSGTSYPDREGIALGVALRHPLLPGVMFQPGLQLVQRGWGDENQPTLSTYYLELPLLLRIGALSAGGWPFRPVLSMGPSVSLLLSCGLDGTGPLVHTEGSGCHQRIVAPFQEDYTVRRFDAGIIGGLGFEARMGGVILGVDGRYEYGLSDIFPGQSLKSRNGTIFVLLSVSPMPRRVKEP